MTWKKAILPGIFILAVFAAPAALGQADEEILTNAEIVTLTNAGLSPSAIIAVIESRGTDFATGVADLAALSRNGVDSAVIEVMTRVRSASNTGNARSSVRQPGETFADELSGGGLAPEMVVIPPGSFHMGCISGQQCREREFPVRAVTIPRAFAVSKFEVTFEDWDRCVARGDCGVYRPDEEGWGRGRRPVINVSWDDAQAYAAWLSRQTGGMYRLLSEAEWEYASRAGSSTAYAWGNDAGRNRANCNGCGSQWDNDRTAPVGSFPANAFGLHDMHGNIWEWVEDCWNGGYVGAPVDDGAWRAGDCGVRVLRGGSWGNYPRDLRSANRIRLAAGDRISGFGFRVARTLPP